MAGKKRRARSDALEKRRDQLLHAFEAWCRQRGGSADVDAVRLLLDSRSTYLDSNLARWRASDLSDLLLGLYPRKVVLDAGEVAGMVPAVGDFLAFMSETGRMDPASDPLDELSEELEEIEEVFPEAMSDQGSFGMAKTLAMAMEADGVDMTDPSAMEDWIAAFNARPEAERRAMLPDPRSAFGVQSRISLPEDVPIPPVRLAPEEELSRAAREAPTLGRLQRFVEWVGEGRRLTDAGRLKLGDVPELLEALGLGALPPGLRLRTSSDLPQLEWTHALADAGLLVDTGRRGLVATDLGRQMGTRPLEAWRSVFEGLLEVGVARWFRGRGAWQPLWTEMLDGALPDVLVLAYLEGRDGLASEDLTEMLWTEAGRKLPAGEPAARATLRPMLASDIERLFEALADLGIAERGPRLALSPLGTWAVHSLLTDEGHSAPSVDYGSGDDPATLFAYWGSLDPDHVLGEIDAWLATRAPEAAVAILAEAARTDPLARSLFAFVLERLGPEAEAAVSALQDDPVLGGYASVWRVEHDLDADEALSDAALQRMMVDQLVSMLIAGGPEAVVEALEQLGPPAEQAALMETLGRMSTPETTQILGAVASAHPDATVSRAARKGQFRAEHRSAPRSATKRGKRSRKQPRPRPR